MQRVRKNIEIAAPIARVYEYVADSKNLPDFWPSMVEVRNVTRLPNGGFAFEYVYKMAGVHFTGKSECIVVKPNERLEYKNIGGIPSTVRWIFEPKGTTHVKVFFEVDYEVPIPVLGKLAEAAIIRINEHESELLLANLKTEMEFPLTATGKVGREAELRH